MTRTPSLDTRPLFDSVRRYAYQVVHEYDENGYEQFLGELTGESLQWMHDYGRRTDGSRAPWTDDDERKAVRTAEKIAEWTWERLHESSTEPSP